MLSEFIVTRTQRLNPGGEEHNHAAAPIRSDGRTSFDEADERRDADASGDEYHGHTWVCRQPERRGCHTHVKRVRYAWFANYKVRANAMARNSEGGASAIRGDKSITSNGETNWSRSPCGRD